MDYLISIRPLLLPIALSSLLAVLPQFAWAQTYKVGDHGSARQEAPKGSTQSSANQLGWGSNIQNARLARAAQLALQKGDSSLAVHYAQQAAHAAPNDPQLWFLLGYAARLNGKLQLAESSYERGLHLAPTSLDGKSGLAQTYSLMGRTAQAESMLLQILTADPSRATDAAALGNLYMRSGEFQKAVGALTSAEKIRPSARSELLLALSYQRLDQMDLARRYLQMAKQRAPNSPDVLRSLAGYFRDTGDYKSALNSLRSIRNPSPEVVAELAYTYQLAGDLSQSAEYYRKAADALPKNVDFQLSAAQAEVGLGATGKAKPYLQRAAQLEPDSYRLHAILGQAAKLDQEPKKAIDEYNAALKNLPAHPVEGQLYGIQLHMNLVELYRELGDNAESQRHLATAEHKIAAAAAQLSGTAPFLRLRALIRMNSGNFDGALNDMKQVLAFNAHDPNNLQLDGDILMKMGRIEDAISVYRRVLKIDPDDRYALTSLGFASRALGRYRDAEKYFQHLARAHPKLYVPYLALGDLYASRREVQKAATSYTKAYALNPQNALIVAGAMNNAIQDHDFKAAGEWLARATEEMKGKPRMLREQERYWSFEGEYARSAAFGRKAIQVLPGDRDVVVYLGYDLLHLNRYDELLKLTSENMNALPHEPDLPLLAGYVRVHRGELEQARGDFTLAIDRDSSVTTAYVNRGYVLNSLHQPALAAKDFEVAIKQDPKDGQAHLGLAFSNLALNRLHGSIEQADLAEKLMGSSKLVHLIRATAYGRQGRLEKAILEYRAALTFSPDDSTLHLALGNALFGERHYGQAIPELETAARLSPQDPTAYAMLARSYAQMQDSGQTRHYVEVAEKLATDGPEQSEILIVTGQALNEIGDQEAAMARFRKGLTTPGSNRVGIRLAIANLMAKQGHSQNAEREIGLALMEAQAGVTEPPTGSELIGAANVFRDMHEYQLSQSYLERARTAGASDAVVRIGLANNYIALGDTFRAQAELAAVRGTLGDDSVHRYQYLLAEANVFEQEHRGPEALNSFARAADIAGGDPTAERALLRAGANEGLRVNPYLSVISNFSVQPIFEDTTVYVLDSKLDAATPVPESDTSLLPPPRSSLQTQWTGAYHLHLPGLPTAGGLFQVRNARGLISVPATSSIVNRNTTDYIMNFGVTPTIRLGNDVLTFDSGIQGTIRRDSRQPVAMNQNLFRMFTYLSTSSFFNVISMSGFVIHDGGPFTERDLHSNTLAAAVDFRVGRPWGRTALVTGWQSTDQNFKESGIEDYFTNSYIGVDHRFSEGLDLRLLLDYVRAWRRVAPNAGIAQNLRPAGTFSYSPSRNWRVQLSSAYSSNRGFHIYDATENSLSISYAKPFHRKFDAESGEVSLSYPIRISAGVQTETFFNFSQGHSQQIRPYIGITLF